MLGPIKESQKPSQESSQWQKFEQLKQCNNVKYHNTKNNVVLLV